MSKNSITVIIPVHELNEVTTASLEKALVSAVNQKVKPEKVVVVTAKDAELVDKVSGLVEKTSEMVSEGETELTVLVNDGNTNFQSQVNLGVEKLETSHFTVLEYDDELTPIWIDNAKKYIVAHPEMDMFLPIIVDLTEKGEYIGFTNEPVWANEFSTNLGEIDNEAALRYSNFKINGMVMTKEKYKEIGGLKPSMDLVFPYEFLLRATNFSSRVMVIPKLGYKHVEMREGSLFDTYKENMSADERRWWVATAKKEYFHVNDRKITYEK